MTRVGIVWLLAGLLVVGPSGQGLTTGEFADLLRAIDKNVTYANVHSSKHTGGEIRGQCAVGGQCQR